MSMLLDIDAYGKCIKLYNKLSVHVQRVIQCSMSLTGLNINHYTIFSLYWISITDTPIK